MRKMGFEIKFSERTREIVASPVRKIATILEKLAGDKEVISFGGGAPSFAPPREIIEFLVENLEKEPHKTVAYGSTKGMPKILQLFAELLKNEEGVEVNPEKEITLTDGGTEGLFLVLCSVVEPGTEVIIANPTYLGYREPIKIFGGKTAEVPVRWQEDFQMLPERIAEKVNKRTRAILMLSPDNPTGRVLEKKNIEGIVDLAVDKNLLLITDDIYKDMIYEGKFYNPRKFGGYENTVSCCSLSKSASIPGFRMGYVYGPEKMVTKVSELKQYASLCPSRPAQYCLEKFLENKARVKNDYIQKTVLPTYRERRDFMAQCIKKYLPEAGFSIPRGAFYFFPNVSTYLKRLGLSEETFCDRLFAEKKVVAIPGNYFGSEGRDHLRLTFVAEPKERIKEGFERIAGFMGN